MESGVLGHLLGQVEDGPLEIGHQLNRVVVHGFLDDFEQSLVSVVDGLALLVLLLLGDLLAGLLLPLKDVVVLMVVFEVLLVYRNREILRVLSVFLVLVLLL